MSENDTANAVGAIKRHAVGNTLVERRISILGHSIRNLKAKFLTLQEAVVGAQTGGAPVDPDHPMAEVNPLEFRAAPVPSTRTIVSFAGLAMKNSMPPREFLRSLSKYDANILLCKDFRQCWYQRGLLALSDNVPDTVPALRRFIPEGQTHLAAIGTSAGGYAAIMFGVMMNMDKILAFGPQTVLTQRVYETFQNNQSTFRDLVHNGNDYMNLAKVIQMHPGFTGQIQVHYSKGNAEDAEAAQRLQRFSCVELVEHDSEVHGVAKVLKESGQFESIVDWVMTPA